MAIRKENLILYCICEIINLMIENIFFTEIKTSTFQSLLKTLLGVFKKGGND